MKNLVKMAAVAAFTFTAVQANAQAVTEDVPFSGSITNTCTITLGGTGNTTGAGTLAASTNNTVLSSIATGGASGLATIDTNSSIFDVSVADPSGFGAGSPTPNGSVTFDATHSFGANNQIGAGSSSDLPTGSTEVSVDLVATAANPLPTGTYDAIVVLTCS